MSPPSRPGAPLSTKFAEKIQRLKKTHHGIRDNEPMSSHTSFRSGGPAAAYVQVKSLAELTSLLKDVRDLGIPHLVLGGGSNLIVDDGGVEALVIEVRARGIHGLPDSLPSTPVEVIAEAGAPLAALGRKSARLGLSGLEWASDVPGTVGGAVVNNAGANGGAIADSLVWADVLDVDGSVVRMRNADLHYDYRRSVLKVAPDLGIRPVVMQASFLLNPSDPLSLAPLIARYSRYRKQTQPVGHSAGSMFKNSPVQAAGWFIDKAGLKGTQIGDARISDLHGNFFLNTGAARTADALALVDLAKRTVFERFEVELELEIQLVGKPLSQRRVE